MPASRPGWRLETPAYLGFELFQKTVWRSAAARLQQRPKRGAQRNSIARGLAGPGEDEGLLGVCVPAGFFRGALGAARSDLAREPRDSAFWAGAARHPAPPPPRPACGRPGAGGLGRWRRGARGRGAEPAPLPGHSGSARRVRSLAGLRAASWACLGGESVSPAQ